MKRITVLFVFALTVLTANAFAQTATNINARSLMLLGATTDLSNKLTLQAPALTGGGYSLTFPAADGAGVLTSNGAGTLSWLTATDAATASAIVRRDASKGFAAGRIVIVDQNELRINDLDNSNYVGFGTPTDVTTSYTLIYPAAPPSTNGQILSSTTGGVLSWITPSAGTVTNVTATSPLSSSGGATPDISIQVANTSQSGYLSSADWNTFDSKLSQVYIGPSTPITGLGTFASPLVMAKADAATNGYLHQTDWTTFNNKLSQVYIGPSTPITGLGTFASPLVMAKADAATNGYLHQTDWTTFNNKLSSVYVTAPITGDGTIGTPLAMAQANGSTNGYLSSTDWTTFNNKQSALTLGNLTSSDITVTGGTGAVVGSGTSLTIANSAVTFGKIQDITDNRLLGRSAGSAGPVQEITVGSGLSLSGGSLTLQSSSVWLTGGNASTPGDGSVYVGTSDAQPLYLKVNNGTDNRMVLFVNSAISMGKNAVATQPDALAMGTGSNAGGAGGSISIGPSSVSTGASAVSIGNGAQSTSTGGIAIGGGSTSGPNSVAIGPGASAAGTSAKAEGHNASAAGDNSVALGSNSSVVVTAPSSISIGPSAVTMVNSSSTVVIGASAQAQANSNNGVALGSSAVIMSPSSISIGPSAVVQTLSSSSISIGNGASTTGTGSTNVGGGGNIITSDYSAIMGGRGLTLDGDRSFGFHSNNAGGTAPMTIASNDVVVFGNSSIWLANNNSTPSSLVFYEAESGTGAFPSSTKSVSFVAPSVLTTTQSYTLPLDYPASSGMVLSSTTGGALSWVSGSGLTNFTEAINTAAPNATVPVASLTATNAATDVDAAFVPKGAGALLAQIPDGTATGGNKRGTNAVDFQFLRGSATQVASGNYSMIGGGRDNTAGGTYSAVIGGFGNAASGEQSIVLGGRGLTLDATADNSFGYLGGNMGSNNMTISEANTVVFGNTNLWLANNNSTASELRFYEPESGAGAFPSSTAYTSFKAGAQSADINYTLPTTQPTANQVLAATAVSGSGPYNATLGWASSPSAVISGNVSTNLAVNNGGSVTEYIYPQGISIANTSETLYNTNPSVMLVNRSGTIRNLYVRLETAPGTAHTRTFTIRVNSTNSSVSVAISGTSTSGSDITNSVSVSANDTVTIQEVCVDGGSGNPAGSRAAWSFGIY